MKVQRYKRIKKWIHSFVEIMIIWGVIKNKDNYKRNSECKQIFNKLIKMDYFHHVDYIEDFIATNCFIPGIDEGKRLKKYKNMNTFINLANDYLGYDKKGWLVKIIVVLG